MLTGSLELQTGLVVLADTNNDGDGGVGNLSNVACCCAVFKPVNGAVW